MRKAYNSLYYKRNKENILTKLKTKVNCEFCNRQVSFCNLQKHYVLPICKTTQDKNKYILERKTNI
jgi:hypothetical protein